MPNGKLGDHPLTDMLDHDYASQFPQDVFEAVRELAANPHFDHISERVASLLWDNWPNWNNVEPNMEFVRRELVIMKTGGPNLG